MKRLILLPILAALAIAGCSAETQPATNVAATSAKLHATVSCVQGDAGQWWFSWRRSPSGLWTGGTHHNFDCTSGAQGPGDVNEVESSLQKFTPYDFRICGTLNGGSQLCYDSTGNSNGTAYDSFHTTSGQLYDDSSPWNTPIAASPTLDANSSTWAGRIATVAGRDVGAGAGNSNAVQSDSYSTPLFKVDPGISTGTIHITGPDGNPNTRDEAPGMQAFLTGVPIPSNLTPASGSDAHITVWQPSSDLIYSCWDTHFVSGQWQAGRCDGSDHAATAKGYAADSEAADAAGSNSTGANWSSTGTGLPVIAGTITLSDLQQAEATNPPTAIEHTLGLDVPGDYNNSSGATPFSFPAQEHDGSAGTAGVNEGARFQVDPSFNCLSGTGTGGHPNTTIGKVLCLTMKKYGAIDRDSSGAGLAFYAADPTVVNGDATYYADQGLFDSSAWWDVLDPDHFPWGNLRVIAAAHCGSAPCP